MSRTRSGKELSIRLKEASCIYLEHHQFGTGFDFLDKLVTGGTSDAVGQHGKGQAYVPLASQLALAATLVVHPSYTTRGSLEEQAMSDRALVFLNHCLAALGPSECAFGDAFQFQEVKVERRRGRRTPTSVSEDDEAVEEMTTVYAHSKSLFTQTESFWHVVGWAFNCARLHPARWARWRLLLDFWLDVVEAEKEDCRVHQNFPANGWLHRILKRSGERHEQRRIMRAIFADGGQISVNEFGEIYANETKVRKKVEAGAQERRKVNLDEDEWGDFDQDVEEDIEMEDASTNAETDASAIVSTTDRINLQARLVSILLSASALANSPFRSNPALLDHITEYIKPLPLNDFTTLLTTLRAPAAHHLALLLNTIEVHLPTGLPRTNLLHASTAHITTHFLHTEARSASSQDNARLSLLVEHVLVQLLAQRRIAAATPELRALLRRGVDARRNKADLRGKGARQRTAAEVEADAALRFSGERILGYLALLEAGLVPDETGGREGAAGGMGVLRVQREDSGTESALSSPPGSEGVLLRDVLA